MGETIARNKKAFHDMPRKEIVPCGTILADKVSSIGNILTAEGNANG
jgi:hypothetical protein